MRLAAGGGRPPKTPTFATVRVRLPEGLLLQGEFNAGEPVSALSRALSGLLLPVHAPHNHIHVEIGPLQGQREN